MDYARAFVHRGEALLELGLHAEALISFERALGFDPRYVLAHLGRAKTFVAMQQHQAALQIYDRIRKDEALLHHDPDLRQAIEQAILAVHEQALESEATQRRQSAQQLREQRIKELAAKRLTDAGWRQMLASARNAAAAGLVTTTLGGAMVLTSLAVLFRDRIPVRFEFAQPGAISVVAEAAASRLATMGAV